MVGIKGAPITFDLDKLLRKLKELKEDPVCKWPLYDRLLHNPIEDKITVDGDIILLEGNYLLLDTEGRNDLSSFADYTISLIHYLRKSHLQKHFPLTEINQLIKQPLQYLLRESPKESANALLL